MQTIVIPSDVNEIADDAFANCGCQDRLYIREGADIDCLPGHVAWDCAHLSRAGSSFANALQGSDSSAFSGCPEFDGFVDD